MFYLYLYVNKINNKIYVGQTKNIRTRDKQHIIKGLNGDKRSTNIDRAIAKYGRDNFDLLMIDCRENQEEIDKLEILYIQCARNLFGNENVYNIMNGGKDVPHRRKFSPEQEKEICEKYANGLSQSELSMIYECARLTIKRIVENNFIKIRNVSEQNKGKMPKNIGLILEKKTPDYICQLIIEEHKLGVGTRKLAQKFNLNRSTIIDILRRNSCKN